MTVIIGSGLAAYMLAKEWRKLDSASPLTIITQSGGEFYSKPLLSTALTQQREPAALAVSSVEEMATQLGASIIPHVMVTALNAQTKTIDYENSAGETKQLEYDRCVLACGAKPLMPQLQGDGVESVFSINQLEDYTAFRQALLGKKRVLVMGAGLVGCEFSNDLLNQDYDVTVVAPETQPLSQLIPADVGAQLRQAFSEKGVCWHLGELVEGVFKAASGYRVQFASGKSAEADIVLSAIGLRPNLLLADSAGLKVNYGIVVDRYLQTSDPFIYALGDCAEVAGMSKMYVAPILQCARSLAKGLAGNAVPVQYPSMPIVIKTPACPVVTMPPPADVLGEWHIEGDACHQQALFHDATGQLRGFALIGDKVRDKMTFAKQLPLVFEN